tara:strand:- start:1240 stop:1530 length:291 start_codon:yes stop_codon:yes gene_type:complete
MFWLIYIASSISISLLLSRLSKEYSLELLILLLIIFITPAQIESAASEYAPSLFTFVFNIVFEQNFSTRVLRPILLSISLGLLSILVFKLLKRKFF